MDSLTHIALGAIIGEAIAGKALGKRAMLMGALAQSLPDIDFLASFWLPGADNLLAHRGFTHSFLLGLMATWLLTFIVNKWYLPATLSIKKWILFFGVEIFTHLFLDAFNTYGVGWFEPFSHYRVSFNVLFVADPLYSVWLGIACIAVLIVKRNSNASKLWISFGLIMSSLYLTYALYNKFIINAVVKDNLSIQHLNYNRVFTTPTAFNNWLWYIVAEDTTGYHIGYYSVFDHNRSIKFNYFHRNDTLLKSIYKQREVQKLLRFSQGYYTVDNLGDTLVFNDLRFGKIMGWNNLNAKFVFRYYLQHPEKNLLVMQRGRFSGWNKKQVKAMWKRIQGN